MFTQFVGLLQTQASRDIAVQGIMGRGLIRDQIRNHPAAHQFWIDLSRVSNQTNRERLTLLAGFAHLIERLVQRTGHLIAIASLQTPLNALLIDLYRKADSLIHNHSQWLSTTHTSQTGSQHKLAFKRTSKVLASGLGKGF